MDNSTHLRCLLPLVGCLLLGAARPMLAQTPAPTGLASVVKGNLGATVQRVLIADNKTATTWADDLDKSGLATPDLSAKQKELLTTFVADVADYKTCLARAYRLIPLQEPDRDDKLKGQGHGDNTPWDDADASFRRIIAAESAAETASSPDFFGSTAFQNYRAALFAKADALKNLRDLMTLAGDAAGDRKALDDYAAGAGVLTVSKEPGAKFSVIGDAVTAAEAGSLVTVKPGTYQEKLNIDKALMLMGDGPSDQIIVRPEKPHQHFLRGSYDEIQGVTFQNSGILVRSPKDLSLHSIITGCTIAQPPDDFCSGVEVQGDKPIVNIRSSVVTGSIELGTVFVTDGATVNISDCIINGIGKNGLGVHVRSYGKSNLTLRSCTINATGLQGIYFDGGSAHLDDCLIRNSKKDGTGIRIDSRLNSPPVTIEKCRIVNCSNGIEAFGSALIEETSITGSSDTGITISGRHLFNKCTIDHCSIGVELINGGNTLFYQCRLAHNKKAVIIDSVDPKSPGWESYNFLNLNQCSLDHNAKIPITVKSGAGLQIQDCNLLGLGSDCVQAEKGAMVKFINTKMDKPSAKASVPKKFPKALPRGFNAKTRPN